MPSLMFGVLAPERLPIWKYPSVSYAEHGDYARGMAYTGTVHTVVDSAELFQGGLQHISTLASSVMLTFTSIALKEASLANFSLFSAAARAPSSLMSAHATPLAPASAKATAVSLPMPLAA